MRKLIKFFLQFLLKIVKIKELMTLNSFLNIKESLGLVQDGFEHFNQKSAP